MNTDAAILPSLSTTPFAARGRWVAVGFRTLERAFDRTFGVAANPLRQLRRPGFYFAS